MNRKYVMPLLAAIVVTLLSVGFASCSDDDEQADATILTLGTDAQKSMMGTWGLIRWKTRTVRVAPPSTL